MSAFASIRRPAFTTFAACTILGAGMFTPSDAKAVLAGQIETFNGAVTTGWRSGENADQQPQIVLGGGISGSTDGFLSAVTSGTHNTQSRLVIFNRSSQWLGDYTAAGVTAIEMDLKNFGDVFGTPITLQLRIAFKETADATSSGYASTVAFTLPDDGKWHHVRFSLLLSDMTPVGTPTKSLAQLLSSLGEIRILHSINPALKGDLVDGLVQLGIDNIQAVPEPSAAVLLILGGTALLSRRSRTTKCK